MKRIILIALIISSFTAATFAQDGERIRRGKERIESLKIAFITEKLELTPEESQSFWPIYRAMHDQLKSLRPEDKIRPADIESLTDAEADEMIERRFEAEEKRLAIKRDYSKRLRKVLPAKKVAMLQPVEKAFKQQLLKRVRRGKRGRDFEKRF